MAKYISTDQIESFLGTFYLEYPAFKFHFTPS